MESSFDKKPPRTNICVDHIERRTATHTRDSSTATNPLESKMPPSFRLSLSYPNPSLGQIAFAREDVHADDQKNLKTPGSSKRDDLSKGSRAVLIVSLLTGLLFSSLDTSIVSTSLVTISHDLGDFVNAPWIVLAYLLTYMGFAVSISKLSDIYGRRNMLVLSWVLFTAFSLGCASSKSMVALIVCRAFQGIGASGLYSLTQISLVEVGPADRPSLMGAMIGATLAVAFVLGPIIGGLISQLSDWRWLFNMNIPFGLVAILVITNFWPQEKVAHMLSLEAFKSIDFVGSISLLCSSGFLVFAVQQAGSQTFRWNSPQIIASLTISALSWMLFIGWEVLLELKRLRTTEPIFPIRLMLRRVYLAGMLITFLTGFPYIALCIVIPERFQIVGDETVLMAGVHILPLLGACAFGSFLGGALSSKKNNTSYTLVAASCFQLLGIGLMTIISDGRSSIAAQYAFQAIFGLGVGLCFSGATIMTNILAAEPHQRASAQGAVAQARVLGGCIGLSICTVIFNLHVNRYLESHVTPEQLEELHRSPLSSLKLPVDLRDLVRSVYSGAFAEETKVMAFICAVMVVISLFTLEKHPPSLEILTASQPREQIHFGRECESDTELNDVASILHTV